MAKLEKLTQAGIAALQPKDKDAIYWDADLAKFGLKVTPAGNKSFLVMYRPKGHTGASKKVKIGNYPEWTLQRARDKARELLLEGSQGIDIMAVRRAEKQRRESNQLSDVIKQFIVSHASRNKSAKETERILQNELLSPLGNRSVLEIQKRDIIPLVDVIERSGKVSKAAKTLANIRKFFNWCVERDILTYSPAQGIRINGGDMSRDRALDEKEIKAIITAARTMGSPFGPFFELLFLTAQRRNEVAKMRWSEIDLEKKIWTVPAERAKNDKVHDVHLCDAAIAILKNLPRFTQISESGKKGTSDFVFTTTGTTPISGFSKAKKQLDKLCAVHDWRVHDIRRTVATGMQQLDIRIEVVERVLNHVSGTMSGITKVYQRYDYMKEREEAITLWCQKLAAIVASEPVSSSQE